MKTRISPEDELRVDEAYQLGLNSKPDDPDMFHPYSHPKCRESYNKGRDVKRKMKAIKDLIIYYEQFIEQRNIDRFLKKLEPILKE